MLARTSKGAHVAFVVQGLGAGGSEHVVSWLCNHFAAAGWTVTLFAFEDPEARPYYDHHPAVRILPLGMKAERRSALGGLSAMRRRTALLRSALRVVMPDVVVSFLTRTNVMTLLAARGLRCPVIVSERNNPALQTVGPVWGALRRLAYPRAYGLVTMTSGALGCFPPAMRRRGWVIPNPATSFSNRAPLSDGHTLAAVGRMVPQKGFDLLIDAFAMAAPKLPGWRLAIWGDGPDREALVAQRDRLGLAARIDFPGVSATPGAWIARTDAFVLSSRFEGWGLVLSEAMMAGLPVVAFDCEWGPAEMIEDGVSGLLVPTGDVPALSRAIVGLCSDSTLRARLSIEAREAMERFMPDQVLRLWEDVVLGALGAGEREGAREGAGEAASS